MTKLIALVLAASLVACAADADGGSGTANAPHAVDASPAPSAPSASEACPSETPSTGPRKTPGLIEKCEGAYVCKEGMSRYHLQYDGKDCRMGTDAILEADGRVTNSEWWAGTTWSGNSLYFTLHKPASTSYPKGEEILCNLIFPDEK